MSDDAVIEALDDALHALYHSSYPNCVTQGDHDRRVREYVEAEVAKGRDALDVMIPFAGPICLWHTRLLGPRKADRLVELLTERGLEVRGHLPAVPR